MSEWFEETLYPTLGQRFRIDEVLYRDKTGLQDLVIFRTPVFGRVLALDGVIQVTEGDEFVYHEMMTHVPILAHGSARRVLIIGGGDGGILREVLRHPSVEKAVMVEIDQGVVDFCRAHMPFISAGAFDAPRAEVVIADGMDYVDTTAERFDVIIVDSTDPQGPGEILFTSRFYTAARRCLNARGVMVTQNGVPFLQGDELVTTARRLKPLFADVGAYVAAIPTYYGGLMALGWGATVPGLREVPVETLARRYAEAGLATRYHTPALQAGAFAVPGFVQALVERGLAEG